CEGCNKCARECPSGAITAGPKTMFNGYEIWKSDSQKCATYRITTPGGAMCGRCMKTCPWNLEGIFSEAPFRWVGMHVPATAPWLARLDDAVGNGSLNPVKKWWWDLEVDANGVYREARQSVNARTLQPELKLRYEDQTLAVYPANLAPHPYPYPFPMDREKGIEAYQAMVTAEEYRARLARGDTEGLIHRYTLDDDSPVIQLVVGRAEKLNTDTTLYELRSPDGELLPEWAAGAHLDIVVAPEFLRQYSMSGNPADRSVFQIGVLREDAGRGGSALMHRIFSEGRKVFVSKPINHFPLHETARKSYLMGGGIGVTPMVAMAHRLHAIGGDFELHYSARTAEGLAYARLLEDTPWRDKVHFHVSDQGTRARFDAIFADTPYDTHVYTCGADRYMQAVLDAAETAGVPETHRHLEYFSVPEAPEWENHPFTLKLARSGLTVPVTADQAPTDALIAAGVAVDVKCSDGLCGVCQCGLVSGEVEHRDYVLSKAQRAHTVILCQSRAVEKDGVIEIDM
ncbi:MAG: 4Fe-4S dicluster domain-containing protein, partial [Pseudomonadota bacterium]